VTLGVCARHKQRARGRAKLETNPAFEASDGQLIIQQIKGIQRGFNAAPPVRD
jgi:hypothetical protein